MIAEGQSDVNVMAVDSPELSVGHKRQRADVDVQENPRVVRYLHCKRMDWRVVILPRMLFHGLQCQSLVNLRVWLKRSVLV